MPRCNGSYIGFDANPNANAASGMWTVREAENHLRADKWPASPTVPSAPAGVLGDEQVELTWTAPTGGSTVTDYIVQYSSNAGSTWTTFSDGVSTATSATVTGLTNGTGYIFRIIAVNALGESPVGSASGTLTPTADPWQTFLGSATGGNVLAAYDWRDFSSSTLAGRAGPTLNVTSVSPGSNGGLFTDGTGSRAISQSAVSVSYPFTIVGVSNQTTAGSEGVLAAFGETPPFATVFSRSFQGYLGNNGIDNQSTGFYSNGQWYFIAVSFGTSSPARYHIRTSTQALNGTITAQNSPSSFTKEIFIGRYYSVNRTQTGRILLVAGISQGFSTQQQMEDLYEAMHPLFAATTSLPQ
jgi:hypothetical protein